MNDLTKKTRIQNFKHLNKTALFILILFFSNSTIKQAMACDPIDYNFCEHASEGSDLGLGLYACKIIKTSDNKAELQILKKFYGSEDISQITVWSDKGFDCNGWVNGTKVRAYGQEGDTVICFLRKIETIVYEYEKIGDYRAATFLAFPTYIKVENGKLDATNIDGKEIKYTYEDFLSLMKSGACIQYRNTCDVNNPLDLPWLANKIASSIGEEVYNISLFKHDSKTYFAISDNLTFGCMSTIYDDFIDPLPATTYYYDCTGTLVCINDCEDSFINDYYTNRKSIWNYCEYTCNYETKGIVKYDDGGSCEYYIETKQDEKFLVANIYKEFSFKVGQQVEFSFHNDYRNNNSCGDADAIEINCIREIKSEQSCKVPESKIISNPILCGRGIINLETDFDTQDENFTYIFVKVSKADDSFEVSTNTSISDDSACYYGIAYNNNCDSPNLKANNFSEILNADANYTISNCFEIERAEAPGYIITTEPYCIDGDLFTVGITLTGASGNYIIGEDYTGNEVKGVEGENFITLKSGQEFYNFLPRDAVTGCTNDFGLAVQDPGCGCICPAVVAPVCGLDGETYGNKCLAACAGVEVDYIGTCNTLPELFITYPWLNDFIKVNNCEKGIVINVYKAGLFNFVHVQYATGIDRMYFQNGEVICETGDRSTCLNFFNFGDPVDTWQCNGAAIANPDPFFFENYSWLKPMVDANNCEGLTIKQYEKTNHKYIMVETSTACSLYYQNGFLFCTDEAVSVCLDQFQLSQPTKVWVCDDGNNKTLTSATETLFNIMPNPSEDTFKVELIETDTDLQKLQVLDMHGKIIQTRKVASNQKTISFNLADVAKGVYWLQLVSPLSSSSKKIVIH